MQQRISLITLGVRDLKKARAFYDALGWKTASSDEEAESIVAYNMSNDMALGLFAHDALAEDVAKVLAEAENAGGQIVKPALDVFWGGHSGYFSDPDGHLWEVAFNPFSPLGPNGEFQWGGV